MPTEDTIVTLIENGVARDVAVKDITNPQVKAELLLILNSPRIHISGKLVKRI